MVKIKLFYKDDYNILESLGENVYQENDNNYYLNITSKIECYHHKDYYETKNKKIIVEIKGYDGYNDEYWGKVRKW